MRSPISRRPAICGSGRRKFAPNSSMPGATLGACNSRSLQPTLTSATTPLPFLAPAPPESGSAADYTIPLGKHFNLTGEAYEGRALGIFSSASGESVLAVGTPGEHGVESRGGWAQLQANWNAKWQTNLAWGIDSMNARQVPVGDRNKTQTYMGNLIYKWS